MISEQLKASILNEFVAILPRLEEWAHGLEYTTGFVLFPIFLLGISDAARYNVKEGRFDELHIVVGKDAPQEAEWLAPNTAYFDETETVIIPL